MLKKNKQRRFNKYNTFIFIVTYIIMKTYWNKWCIEFCASWNFNLFLKVTLKKTILYWIWKHDLCRNQNDQRFSWNESFSKMLIHITLSEIVLAFVFCSYSPHPSFLQIKWNEWVLHANNNRRGTLSSLKYFMPFQRKRCLFE